MTMPSEPPDRRSASALALTRLPGCTHHRLGALLERWAYNPERAWAAVVAGDVDPALLGRSGGRQIVARWREVASTDDPGSSWQRLAVAQGIGLWLLGDDGYPPALVDDPDPPPVLFHRGCTAAIVPRRPTVAMVGTRRCTAYGTDVARELGRDLAGAGVSVVSGLALGIDGAAHEGALAALPSAAPPIGVVGSGLDVIYPPRHRSLWRRVAEVGILLSEAPPGSAPEPWRFPRRNRILAALADVVVVVESHASGGSLSTVRAAIDRGVSVMAVPGSVRSPSSAGTNRLLADGVAPVTEVDDILMALSLGGAPLLAAPEGGGLVAPETGADPVLSAVDWTPTATEDVLRRTGLSIAATTMALTRLEVSGQVRRRGGWWERVGTPGIGRDRGYTSST